MNSSMRFFFTTIIYNILISTILFCTAFAEISPVINLQESQPNVFALTHAKIQINPDELIEDAHIIIRGERIESVGKNIEIPADAFEVKAVVNDPEPAPAPILQ